MFESAPGLSLFHIKENEVVSQKSSQMRASVKSFDSFRNIVELKQFVPFEDNEQALACLQAVAEGEASELLLNFLNSAVPNASDIVLGLQDTRLAASLHSRYSCRADETVLELVRGIRQHFSKFVDYDAAALRQHALGLGHAYSRSRVKFNSKKADSMIIQSIAVIDQIDKDINQIGMRIREWYSYHFPELSAIVKDNIEFTKVASIMKDKESFIKSLDEGLITEQALVDVVGKEVAESCIEAARHSMGPAFTEDDMEACLALATRVVELSNYRTDVHGYLNNRMNVVAPNTTAVVGDIVGARLISLAGGLTNLAKLPGSTIQVLGAEKALFHAIKTRGKTPKYGHLFNSNFVGRAAFRNKGRVARILASKIACTSRVDCFSEKTDNSYGTALYKVVEERLKFYEEGVKPRSASTIIKENTKPVEQAAPKNNTEKQSKKKEKKSKK